MSLTARQGDLEPKDKWRDVPGYEGRYQCSRPGLVRSLVGREPRLMCTTRHRDGYDKLNLRSADGKQRTFHVHTLIALTFLGPRPQGAVIDHIDLDHTNHAASNLRYLTPGESNDNRRRMRTSPINTGAPCVYRHGRGGYFARSYVRGCKKRLGRFETIIEAKMALNRYVEAA